MKLFSILFGFLGMAFIGHAQTSFTTNQDHIFREATAQYIAVQLRDINPNSFDCKSNQHSWKLPESAHYEIFGATITMSESELKALHQLYFPDGDCKRFLSLMSLCDLYFPLFRKQIEDQSLHEDYRYFPLILSGCNQSYRSKNNQCGLWAMDYLVARRQHLRIDSLIDERNGGDFSSKAALTYLKELNTRYLGDHLRTLLAYYGGVPYVESIPFEVQGQDLIDGLNSDMRQLILCYAYTKSLITSARLTNHLNSYFDIMGQYDPLVVQKETRKDALVHVLGSNMNSLRGMNPVYIGNTIPVGYRKVAFMLDKVEALKFEALADSVYQWTPPIPVAIVATEEVEEVIYYKVKRGDSLGKIAEKYKVTVKQLKKWNNLKSDKISKGKKLKIIRTKTVKVEQPKPDISPVGEKPLHKDTTAIAPHVEVIQPVSNPLDDQIEKLEQQATACIKKKDFNCAIAQYQAIIDLGGDKDTYEKKIAKANRDKKSSDQVDKKVTYTVKSGDSLWSIARKYPGVTEKDIMKWNKCSENIRPGQKLIIYTKPSSKSK